MAIQRSRREDRVLVVVGVAPYNSDDSPEEFAPLTELSPSVRRALIAIIVLLLGVGVVGALSVGGSDDREDGGTAIGTSTTTARTDVTTTTTTADTTTSTTAPTPTTTAGGAGTGTDTGGAGTGDTGTGSGSGLGSSGSGGVATGPGVIAETGADDMLLPALALLGVAAAARQAAARSRERG